MQLYPGTIDQYFDYCARENAIARREQEEYERSLTDQTLQCHHGRSLFWSCSACGEEANAGA